MERNGNSSKGNGDYDEGSAFDRDAANQNPSGLELAEAPAPERPPVHAARPAHNAPPEEPLLRAPARRYVQPAAPPAPASTSSAPRAIRIVAVVLVAVVAVWFGLRRTTVPDLVVTDAEKNPLHLADLRQGHAKLLIVFMAANSAGDPATGYALSSIKAESARRPDLFALAGFDTGTQADADSIRTKMDLAFPVYSLKDAPNPFAVHDFVKKAGIDPRRIYSGSSLVLDDQQHVLLLLEGDEIEKLPEKLAALKN